MGKRGGEGRETKLDWEEKGVGYWLKWVEKVGEKRKVGGMRYAQARQHIYMYIADTYA